MRQVVGSVVKFVLASALVVAVAAPAAAFQCPSLVKKINDEAEQRFDDAAYNAKTMAAEADALHKAGKHAEAEAKAKEAMKLLNLG
jgi:hypothetical protein